MIWVYYSKHYFCFYDSDWIADAYYGIVCLNVSKVTIIVECYIWPFKHFTHTIYLSARIHWLCVHINSIGLLCWLHILHASRLERRLVADIYIVVNNYFITKLILFVPLHLFLSYNQSIPINLTYFILSRNEEIQWS
jgi:hypothetical protein